MTKSNKKSEHILDIAGRLFREQGFDATTTRDIAKEAKVLLGSLHYQFETKEALLEALMARGVSRAMQAVELAGKHDDDILQKVRLGLRAHLTLLCDPHDSSLHVMLYDFRSLNGPARKRIEKQRAKYEIFWDSLLQQVIDVGLAKEGVDVTLIRQFGFGALNWVPTWHTKKSKQTPQQIADSFFNTLAFGLLRTSENT